MQEVVEVLVQVDHQAVAKEAQAVVAMEQTIVIHQVTDGTVNTGGGGGGGNGGNSPEGTLGKSGGSGIVIIRYKFQ